MIAAGGIADCFWITTAYFTAEHIAGHAQHIQINKGNQSVFPIKIMLKQENLFYPVLLSGRVKNGLVGYGTFASVQLIPCYQWI